MVKYKFLLIYSNSWSCAHLSRVRWLEQDKAMGIHCLFPYLKDYSKRTKISQFKGKIAAIDASCFLHKALYISLKERGNREGFIEVFEKYLNLLRNVAVVPFVVFDGLKLPAKSEENERRQRNREKQAKKGAAEDSNRSLALSATITYDDTVKCIQLCISHGVRYIVSPYEADAQIAFLIQSGHADLAITEDSDLLAYGCKEVLVKLKLSGIGECFCLPEILQDLKMSKSKFLEACIVAGCDYLKNVPGIGINKAFKLFTEKTVEDILDDFSKKVPNYESDFCTAKAVFLHQTVFDPVIKITKPINEWNMEPSLELQHMCGSILAEDYAIDLASGNIDVSTGQKCNDFQAFVKESASSDNQSDQQQFLIHQKQGCTSSAQILPNTDLHINVIQVTDKVYNWQIPCFPVMDIDFKEVKFGWNGMEYNGLVNKTTLVSVGHALCTSHCSIILNGKHYTVLWVIEELSNIAQDEGNDEDNTNDSSSTENDHTEVYHSLPFKVLGSCYSKDRQKALKEAYDYLYEHNRPVLVKLTAEPENVHDNNAIAVTLLTYDSYEKVGYIASELTQYVHPCLRDPSFSASVNCIRFRTTFLIMGYYLSITVTKKGLWHSQVVKASKSVQ